MTDDEKAKELADAIRALGEVFVGRLPATIAAMDGEMAQISQKYQDLTPWQNLHRQLHSMAGSAGTFGYDELGDKARALELRASDIFRSETMTTEKNRTDFVADMRSYMDWVRNNFIK